MVENPSANAKTSNKEGYTFDSATDALSTSVISSSRDVDIQGKSGRVPPSYITFDDPHLPAGTALVGQYPSGVIEWGNGEWQIGTPYGKFGTFTLALSDPKAPRAGFDFFTPLVFVGVDIYNDGESDATITFRSPENREVSFTIKSKDLRRLRTDWRDVSSRVSFDITNGRGLRFDNLAYLRP